MRRIVLRIMLLRQAPTNRRASGARKVAQRRPTHSLPKARPAEKQLTNRYGSADSVFESPHLRKLSVTGSEPPGTRSLRSHEPSSTSIKSDDKAADEALHAELARRDVVMTTSSVRSMLAADTLKEDEHEHSATEL